MIVLLWIVNEQTRRSLSQTKVLEQRKKKYDTPNICDFVAAGKEKE